MIFCKNMINNGVDKTGWMHRLVCTFVFRMTQKMFATRPIYVIMDHQTFAV